MQRPVNHPRAMTLGASLPGRKMIREISESFSNSVSPCCVEASGLIASEDSPKIPRLQMQVLIFDQTH